MKIGIVDYNMGNLASVNNAFKKIGADAEIVKDADKIKNYDKLVLPGVGAFGDAMEHLKETGLDEALIDYAKSGRYVIGVCLGMQLLFDSSEEFGNHEGLGLIDGRVVLFDKKRAKGRKIPHMGWNKIFVQQKNPIFEGLK
jgi:glutamine amidotransferase